jgi:Domain of unknown function (DUF4915)
MSGFWKSYDEVRESCKDKKLIFWGRSEDWTAKTLSKIKDLNIEYIVDSSEVYNNTQFLGYDVFLPSKLNNENLDEIFIVITASAYESIELSMTKFNLKAGIHYCCTPEYKDWALLQNIKEYDRNLLITCSDNTLEEGGKRFSKMGGGLYLFNTKTHKLENKKQGHFRQVIEIDNLYYVVEYIEKLLYVFDKKFNVINKIELDQSDDKKQKPHYCGIAYHEKSKQLFVANSGTDTISIYNKETLNLTKLIYISNKTKEVGGGLHHINDLTVVDDSLLVSCFSVTGAWKKEILDGGLFEYNINNLDETPNILVNHLWKPHSVEFYENKVSYLDSMRGDFWIGNQKIVGKFNGFVRGLAFDGKYYFIGQSEDMYTSELFGIKDNIMINAGVYLFDVKTRVSRFYSFPDLSNIHDIKIHKD